MRRRRKTLIATLALAVLAVMPGIARAGDDAGEAPATESETATSEMTQVVSSLPVLGAGLEVTIGRGEGGAIESVALDPAAGATIIKERDHKVVFLLADGNTQVTVKSRKTSVETKVKADATADVAGPGVWTGDLFGGEVVIPYTVSFDGNTPSIAIGEISAPEGVTVEIGEPKSYGDDDGEKSVFKIKVRLSDGETKAKVTLVAKTRVDDDGQLRVSLAVTVSQRNHRWDRDHDGDHERHERDGRDERGEKRDDGRDRDHGDHDRGDGDDDGGDN